MGRPDDDVDPLQGDIYRDHLHANMKNGAALLFAQAVREVLSAEFVIWLKKRSVCVR
jgi:hypothetical protein